MFEGEKTSLFWIGLLILSVASVGLFAVLWTLFRYGSYSYTDALVSSVPFIVAAVVFILVGFYMMRSGVKKPQPQQQTKLA